MTPKEKADELVKRMYKVMSDSVSDITLYFSKQCALVAVDEVLTNSTHLLSTPELYYWNEVKKEIEKL